MNINDYQITKHAINRFVTRFPQYAEHNLTIGDVFAQGSIDKSVNNDFIFMGEIMDKYGYDNRYEFVVSGPVTFAIIEDAKGKMIVTCYNRTGRFRKTKRYTNFIKKDKAPAVKKKTKSYHRWENRR